MNDDPEDIVNNAIERMRSGAVEKEDRRESFYIILVISMVLSFVILFAMYDFVYQQPESTATTSGEIEVTLTQNKDGHYYSKGLINGREVNFLLDTGASSVSVPEALAYELGLHKGELVWLNTANGQVRAYSSRIRTLSLGGIEKTNVKAVVSPSMRGSEILLGMSFLKQLSIVQENKLLKIKD